MRVENKTYKDTYHFKNDFFKANKENLTSLDLDPDINTTIKNNPYRANVEIEKGEIVLQPDLSALFNARGKRHSGGGIDVNLKPDAFIFSNDPSLAIDQANHELFELETKGNKYSKTKNTPALVLKRNIDLDHYNRMVVNIEDPNKDDLAKKSSVMMLEKYINTLGNISFIQEQKKGFPDGVPGFAIGTAPVYNGGLKDEVMAQKQYVKYGGKIRNPYSEFMQLGGKSGNARPNQSGVPFTDAPNPGEPTTPVDTPWLPKIPNQQAPPCEGGYFNYILNKWECPKSTTETTTLPNITPGSPTGEFDNGIDADWQFTPWQKISQGYGLGKLASAKRYMPMRSHLNPSYTEPYLVNPEQTINDARGNANMQTKSLGTLNPIMRNAQSSSIYGELLDKMPGIRSQYDNQNAQIIGQNRLANNQITNAARAQNMQNDQQYYKEDVTGRANFDNVKTFLDDQFMTNLMGDAEKNSALAYNMMTLGPKPAYGFNWKKGNFYRNPKNLKDVESGTSGNTWDATVTEVERLKRSGFSDAVISAMIKSKAFTQMAPYFGQAPTFGQMTSKKKGGRVNPYK